MTANTENIYIAAKSVAYNHV